VPVWFSLLQKTAPLTGLLGRCAGRAPQADWRDSPGSPPGDWSCSAAHCW
jgi:hypothetical protein